MIATHRAPLVALALALASGSAGCLFSNASAETHLRDAVYGFNDAARWGRLDLAVQVVAPGSRARVRSSRGRWGRDLQVADSEVLEIQVDDDRQGATSVVTVRWYQRSSMLVAETRLRQRWTRSGTGYVLVEESVLEGDEQLLDLPEAQTSGDEEPGEPAVAG